jgi:hypothetical protein
MRKVIKLKESDLMNIVKRVIKEQSSNLESKLRTNGYTDAKNRNGKTVLSKKIEGYGNFFFELNGGSCILNVLNPTSKVISNFNLKRIGKNKIGEWYTVGSKPDVECERLMDTINSMSTNVRANKPITFNKDASPFPMDEQRMNFDDMSDEELHSLHPEIKKHPRHFKDFKPTSEYLGWRGEVSNRNMYKHGGKFHNAFDKEIEK